MNSLINLQNVSLSYSNEQALRNINFEVISGEYVGIVGPNGGGKTSLLKIILDLLPPTSGGVHLFGQPIGQFRDWSRIGYVAQNAGSMHSRLPITVEEVVALGRTSRLGLIRHMGAKDHQAVKRAMQKMEILSLNKRLLSELSGGQQQRVLIAKALAAEPELLILDEPTTGIDVKSQDAFYQLLAKLNKQDGLTLVMVSHDIDVMVNEVTRVACINQTLIYHGGTTEFVSGDYMSQLYGKTRKFLLHGH